MIKHIVMWALKDEAEGATAAENAKKMKQMLEALIDKIDVLKHIEVSTDVFASTPDTQVILYSEFDSKEDLDAYQVHEEHQKCVAFIKNVVAERRMVDYVI